MWEELSDQGNIVDDRDVEADYFIDRAPDAIFIPNEEGTTKATQIFDGDKDLFDYEREVEPILQVLVGKSIEHARIEVIEELESRLLSKAKARFMQTKDAELMETQRLEEARGRKNDEVDRRSLQARTTKQNIIGIERKSIARTFAKGFMQTFKRDTLKTMVDIGILRKPVNLSVGDTYVPQLYGQIRSDMQTFKDTQKQIDEMLNDSMRSLAKAHKSAIVKKLTER